MTTGARLIRVVAVLLASGSVSAAFARAEENCLAAPNMQPPQGSHLVLPHRASQTQQALVITDRRSAVQKPTAQEKPEIELQRKTAGGGIVKIRFLISES